MLDIKHIVTNLIYAPKGRMARFLKLKALLDQKCAANLRLLAVKNNINRASDYHYLNLAVTNSTAPVNGLDYIHPVVKPTVDYCTAVIAKGLAQNGEINFEFVADNEDDEAAARQATEMVHKIINQHNDPHQILHHWIMDACLHKNGEILVSPYREQITRYVTTQGTMDQLKAFEQQAAASGLTATRTNRKKVSMDMAAVQKQMAGAHQGLSMDQDDADIQARIDRAQARASGEFEEEELPAMSGANQQLEQGEDLLDDAIAAHTIYEAKYKLVGYNINIRFRGIHQHYWMCDPTVVNVQDQPFCGFYEPMTVAEATERYPDIDLDLFEEYAEYSNVGAYQAGSLLNNLALHARDSVPINGLPAQGYATNEPGARQVTILTVWNRYDIDNDGEMELVEIVYSGQYIISAREVEFIPVADMCPRPLSQNFYGMSIAESVVPMQEYATAGHRAEIQLGLLTATPRLGVKPDKVDFEMMQDGEAAIFILDSKFDPTTDVYPMPAPSGSLNYIDDALGRIQNDVMSMVGMTSPQDVFNPEVMDPGNSGAKLNLALSPNQIIQDNTIKNCAEGLKDAIWLVWRTLIQYSDDYGVKKLAQEYNPDKQPIFLDGQAFDDMNFCERKQLHIDLALGMKSEENSLNRLQIIKQCQQQFMQEITTLQQSGAMTPEILKKVKKPYEDTLYVLGVKDADTYLPTDEEVQAAVQAAQKQAQTAQQPTPAQQAELAATTAKAKLDSARADQIVADTQGNDAKRQLEGYALVKDNKARAF